LPHVVPDQRTAIVARSAECGDQPGQNGGD
jgi:hypothetical protein